MQLCGSLSILWHCLSLRLARLVITFLPKSKCLLASRLQSPSAVIWEPQKIKSDTVSTVSPSIFHEVMGPDAIIFVFWMLSFKPTFSLSTFTFIFQKSNRVPEKHLFLLYWLCQSLWLCGSQYTVENSSRDGSTDHLICLLRNLYAGQEATVRTGHGTTDWFQIGKGVRQGCIFSPCLFNFYAEYIMRNAGLEETRSGSKTAGRNINNLRYADDTTLMAESEEELKRLWVKVESEKVGLKLNIQKTKIMASSPITSWQIDGETVETVTDFFFFSFFSAPKYCRWWLQPWN